MPIGAFVSSKKNMSYLSVNPSLGHITTFGGHPVCCAAAVATIRTLTSNKIIEKVESKRQLFLEHLSHPKIKKIHGIGLMIAIELENEKSCNKFVKKALEKGVITFYFLFNKNCIRISPPLTISLNDIIESCSIIKNVLDDC